jgi:hypothetical protein
MGFVVVMGVCMGLTLKIKLEPSNYFDHNMMYPDLNVVGGVVVAGCSAKDPPKYLRMNLAWLCSCHAI